MVYSFMGYYLAKRHLPLARGIIQRLRSLSDKEESLIIETSSPRTLSGIVRNALALIGKDIKDSWRVFERDDAVVLRRSIPVIINDTTFDILDIGNRILSGENIDIHAEFNEEDIASLTELASTKSKTLHYYPDIKRLVIK